MNVAANLATKFRRKNVNAAFLRSAGALATDLKPDAVIVCNNSVFEESELQPLLNFKVVLVTSDASRYLQLLDSGTASEHFNKSTDAVDDPLRDIIFLLLNRKRASESHNLLITYGKNDWETLSQIQYIELSLVAESNYLRSLASLTHIAPLEILETVIEVAMELGREGREGKPVGTILVLGDHKAVLKSSRSLVFNPFKGYTNQERSILSQGVRDSVKEMAKIDGAMIISDKGIVQAGGQYLDFRASDIQIAPGLGSRHTAAAAVSRNTKAMAVAISESTGVVRVYVDGSVFLQVNPRSKSPIRL